MAAVMVSVIVMMTAIVGLGFAAADSRLAGPHPWAETWRSVTGGMG